MEKSVEELPAKRFKAIDKQYVCSTFECLSDELILNLFEYFNTKEILQSFSNLNSLITSCIYDQRQQLHLHLDSQMPSFPGNYSPDQVISLRLKHVAVQIDIFRNLKSLFIICGYQQEIECLQMINKIFQLSQLVNFTLSQIGHVETLIDHKIIQTALCHSSLQHIVLMKNKQLYFDSRHKDSRIKLAFHMIHVIYVTSKFPDTEIDRLHDKLDNKILFSITPQHHIRHLDLDFRGWKLQSLVELLSALPLLNLLKVKGFSCCNYVYGWLYIDTWDEMLQKLPALQQVHIDICLAIPMRLRENTAALFNNEAAEKIQTCKRINLKVGRRTKGSHQGCVQISASLNMN